METTIILTIVTVIMMILGVPIAVCLGLGASIAILAMGRDIRLCPIMMFDALDSFTLIAIPFFIFAGYLMAKGGMARRIFNFANAIVGWMRGGLGAVTVVASAIFGGMSGSASADAGGLGVILIQEMTRHKYPLNYSAAITLVTSCLSPIIPPSIIAVVYGICAGVSVAKILLAGLLPGLLLAASFWATNYVIATKHGWGASTPFNWGQVLKAFKESILAIMTPVIILGGILSGIVTPTEASCVAVWWALIVCILVYKELKISELPAMILDTARISGIVLFIVATASVVAQLLTADYVPQVTGNFIASLTNNPYVGLGLVAIFLLFVGCVMEGIAAIIVLTPILLPVAKVWGVDPIHLGVIIVVTMAIGVMTPPVGVCLYIICNLTGLSMEDLSVSMLPFFPGMLVCIALLILMPSISLVLINVFW